MRRIYRIIVKEQLSSDSETWFGDWSISLNQNGNTVLTGECEDQSALHGVISLIQKLNLTLISVEGEEDG